MGRHIPAHHAQGAIKWLVALFGLVALATITVFWLQPAPVVPPDTSTQERLQREADSLRLVGDSLRRVESAQRDTIRRLKVVVKDLGKDLDSAITAAEQVIADSAATNQQLRFQLIGVTRMAKVYLDSTNVLLQRIQDKDSTTTLRIEKLTDENARLRQANIEWEEDYRLLEEQSVCRIPVFKTRCPTRMQTAAGSVTATVFVVLLFAL
jgi:hypothetical protein